LKKVSHFSSSKNVQFSVHVYHAIRHNLTTDSPQQFTTFSKTPHKNPAKRTKTTRLHHKAFSAKKRTS